MAVERAPPKQRSRRTQFQDGVSAAATTTGKPNLAGPSDLQVTQDADSSTLLRVVLSRWREPSTPYSPADIVSSIKMPPPHNVGPNLSTCRSLAPGSSTPTAAGTADGGGKYPRAGRQWMVGSGILLRFSRERGEKEPLCLPLHARWSLVLGSERL